MSVEFSNKQFKRVSQIVHQVCGIRLKDGKEALVRSRLMKRVRALRMASIDAYMKYIESEKGSQELALLIDVMTTNKTDFFREAKHFDFLREKILPEMKSMKMRFWSAACSSGEEPFSLAITLREGLADIDSRDCLILATDISNRMLEKANQAIFSKNALQDLPASLIQKHFNEIYEGSIRSFQVKDKVRAMVRIARLNLMDPWPMKGLFNVIFCRNVMIYFDKATQQQLINRFWDILMPGGYLFVGHSEGLSAISHKFRYAQPATYKK